MGNVQWHVSGLVTATYIVDTVNVRFMAPERRLIEYHRANAMYSSITQPFIHESATVQVPPSTVMDRMAATVGGYDNLYKYPAWQKRMDDTLDFITNRLPAPPVEDFSLLHIALPIDRKAAHKTVWKMFQNVTSGTTGPPSEQEQMVARRLADNQYRRLRLLTDRVTEAKESDLRWFSAFTQTFGGMEPPRTHPHFNIDPAFPTPIIPLVNGEINRQPRKHIEIEAPVVYDPVLGMKGGSSQRVYQTFFAVNGFARSWVYPGAALWDDLHDLPFPIRAAYLGRSVPNATARRSLNKIYKHLSWVDEESSSDAVPHIDAIAARSSIDGELSELARHGGPAMPGTIIIGIANTDLEKLEDNARSIVELLDPTQTLLDRVRGKQADLWAALNPGSPRPMIVGRYERQFHAGDIAGLGIHHGHKLGDDTGRLYGLLSAPHEDSPPRLVFRNAIKGPLDSEGNRGALTSNTGDIGAGKSMDAKQSVHDVLALGHGAFVLDRSEDQEMVRFALAGPVPAIVIKATDPRTTIDPLRVGMANLPSSADARAHMLELTEKHTLDWLAIQASIKDDDDPRYDMLARAVHILLDQSNLGTLTPSLPNVLRIMRTFAGDEDAMPIPLLANGTPDPRFKVPTDNFQRQNASAVALKLSNLASSGRVGTNLFGEGKPLDLSAPYIVFSAPGLTFDSNHDRAVIYLVTALALAFIRATDRFNLIYLPELAELGKDRFGLKLVDDVKRQSRRAWGGLITDSQHARDYLQVGEELWTWRTAARAGTETGARDALKFVGHDPTSDDIADLITAPTGRKFIRDMDGDMGWVDVLPPLDQEVRNLARTDPGRPKAAIEDLEAVA
jgi:hypothetical protein